MASLIIRLIILVALILSLAGLEIVQKGSNLAVVFLVDVSDSMPQAAIALEADYVREAMQSMRADDKAAVILFGADALVERPMSSLNELASITSAPITNGTNIAEAINLGLALFPSGYAKRMVILSDGAETAGDARIAAEFARDAGAQVVIVPFVNQIDSEALVTSIDAPTHLRPNEQFDLNVTVQTNKAMRATIRVIAKGNVLYEGAHDLRRGTQTLSLPLTAQEPGFVSYQVQITPEQDAYYKNNRLDAFSQVEGPPRILMVAPKAGETLPGGETRPDEYSALYQVLTSAGFAVELVAPSSLPLDLPTLAQYDSVVLVDVPARELTNRQMENIQSYVRDLGGGLVAVGGPTSYGVGGYYGTPLEDTLPVDMQIKDEQRRPTLAIVFIIDHSGSMGETSGGAMKLELAKEAAARSVEMLFPNDRVGVIAFDDVAQWVVPMTDLQDPSQVISGIGSIQVGGGTDILAGVQAMAKVLPSDPAKVKHVILLTDGGADPTGIPELVQKLYQENGITLSTVGVGNDAAPFLKDLAKTGNGRYHFTNNAGSIPSIFTEETTLATRAYIVEENFYPTLVNSSPILAGITESPQLRGYVASSAKDLAQVILKSEKDDPILATWQYGLGKAVAFTSDATGRWASAWVQSKIFPTFWTQAVRYTINNSANTNLQMTVDNASHITLDARSFTGALLNGYQIEASIVAPNGETQTVTFQQTAPGRYESDFMPKEQGVYLIHFSGNSNAQAGAPSISETTGWALSYSPEYQRITSDPDLLLHLQALSQGQIASPVPSDAFNHDLTSTRAARPVAPWLILLAALLFPFDVAVRRLIITKQDVGKAREWIDSKFARRIVVTQEKPDARIESLRVAKSRVKRSASVAGEKMPVETAPTPSQEKEAQGGRPKSESAKESTTSALLARKKNLKK